MKPIYFLRIEAALVFMLSLYFYHLHSVSWWIFGLFILAPDLFMIGYIRNSHAGALIYNIGHSYISPIILLVVEFIAQTSSLIPFIIIWIAHIAMDRMMGYGLKYDDSFSHTHLGMIGRKMK